MRGPIAHQHLVAAHLRLVAPLARKYRGRGRRDLRPEGHLVQMGAAAKFDYRRGYRFSTYAPWM